MLLLVPVPLPVLLAAAAAAAAADWLLAAGCWLLWRCWLAAGCCCCWKTGQITMENWSDYGKLMENWSDYDGKLVRLPWKTMIN